MPAFAYRAYAPDGRLRAGRIEAEARERAVAALRAEGLQVFEIAPAAAATAFWRRDLLGRDSVNDAGRIAFLKEFGTLLGAGLTVDRALRLVERQAAPALRPVLADLLARVLAGASLSRAMAAHAQAFPQDMVDAVRAGEATGTLNTVIAALTASLERRDAVRRHLRSAMVYPSLLILMALGTLAMVIGVLVPALAPLFEGTGRAPPLVIRVASALGEGLGRHWPALLCGLVLAAAGLARAWNRPGFAGARSALALRLPLVREIVVGAELGRICRVLGTLLVAEVPIPDAVAAARPLPRNHLFRAALGEAGRRLTEGGSLASGLAALQPYAPATLSLIASGEQVNRLGSVLLHAAEMHETQTRERVDRLLALLTPLVTVAIGGLIGGLIVSVMGAILGVAELTQ
ncbi:type II secretion system F family protein [Methylobacterium oxalidis]|uniref:Secretion system protein n=1 Tax=Methylobacterium oxalidis TaxID=944322 RepID=A0A512IZH6_9HYPH|nr:type II secretion system F family protein [Methylobacterium oxalidis]GEP03102.1 secretion system protein [Methylobacterium oxalidis]GJE31737.1 Putative type II secretion system protein F [Methylobacterium oxalidis]GLS67361.1 secretion system protein [Methylobacterium oxalidis]